TEHAPLLINLENCYGVRGLICGKKKIAGWINEEIARRATACRFVPYTFNFARALVNTKDCNGVVASIRAVNEMPRRMHVDVCTGVLSAEIARKCRLCFYFLEGAFR